ncbi:uncharacterized protein EDF57_106142 [Novosphingobium sp. PhB55]|nr:uncharacterized protein EDF57_106142 [Novosphingobium sp. PhB55]
MLKAIAGRSARAGARASMPRPPSGTGGRLASLDLVRGIAVMGILTINISGFAGPSLGALTPDFPGHASMADEAAWAVGFLFFEGKMRALFAMLFGAGIALQCERMDAAGREGDVLQVRRLAWLMVFGTLHYWLLWWGDILFVYGCCGIAVLFVRRLPCPLLLGLAAGVIVTATVIDLWSMLPLVRAEEALRIGTATAGQHREVLARLDLYNANDFAQAQLYHGGFLDIALGKLRGDPFWLFTMTAHAWSEVLPLMLVGVVLMRSGFFSGDWPEPWMRRLRIGATAAGLALTVLVLAWAWPRHFPPIAMAMLLGAGLWPAHLLTALGYAAAIVWATPRLLETRAGLRIIAAGQVAFTNYIGTSLLMCALFYGWGLGLFGKLGPADQWALVLIGWMVMLAWSEPWLSRYRRGPLELLWRSLVEQKRLKNRRKAMA